MRRRLPALQIRAPCRGVADEIVVHGVHQSFQINSAQFCWIFDAPVPLTLPPCSRQFRPCAQDVHRAAAQQVLLNVEGVVDGSMRLKKMLGW
jgi:hypothetical protein